MASRAVTPITRRSTCGGRAARCRRAALFAHLVDDLSAAPEEFLMAEAQALRRLRLFRLIERLV